MKKCNKLFLSLFSTALFVGIFAFAALANNVNPGEGVDAAGRLFTATMPANTGNPWGNAGVRVQLANRVGGIDATARMTPGTGANMNHNLTNINSALANGTERRTINVVATRRTNVTLTGTHAFRRVGTPNWTALQISSRSW